MQGEGLSMVYPVESGNFTQAGDASTDIKKKLKLLGVESNLMRRISVAAYEVELNLVIHSLGGQIGFYVDENSIHLDIKDRGPGIADVELAMKEGYSTASDEVRMMGFGAGMGLPNMKRNADEFSIESKLGEGTRIKMCFYLR